MNRLISPFLKSITWYPQWKISQHTLNSIEFERSHKFPGLD